MGTSPILFGTIIASTGGNGKQPCVEQFCGGGRGDSEGRDDATAIVAIDLSAAANAQPSELAADSLCALRR
jgi:hypothetical protein